MDEEACEGVARWGEAVLPACDRVVHAGAETALYWFGKERDAAGTASRYACVLLEGDEGALAFIERGVSYKVEALIAITQEILDAAACQALQFVADEG